MTAASSDSPVSANFPVRRMDFSFSEIPKYWWDGQPFMTQFMNTMSSLFPYGEKFFVDSVRAVRGQLKDPQLQKDVSAFIGQEAMHSKEHSAYNEYAEKHGIDLACLEQRTKVLMKYVGKFSTQKYRLAITCALEHFTATMAAQLLEREDLTTQIQSPEMHTLWMWHAIEESEHKSVVYDVYQTLYGGYFTRILVMLATTLIFFGTIVWFHLDLLRKDGQLFNWRSWRHGLVVLFGLRKGLLTRLLMPYLDYYRPSFHPSDRDTANLEKHWKDRLAIAD